MPEETKPTPEKPPAAKKVKEPAIALNPITKPRKRLKDHRN
jgi:hypothetical protein